MNVYNIPQDDPFQYSRSNSQKNRFDSNQELPIEVLVQEDLETPENTKQNKSVIHSNTSNLIAPSIEVPVLTTNNIKVRQSEVLNDTTNKEGFQPRRILSSSS